MPLRRPASSAPRTVQRPAAHPADSAGLLFQAKVRRSLRAKVSGRRRRDVPSRSWRLPDRHGVRRHGHWRRGYVRPARSGRGAAHEQPRAHPEFRPDATAGDGRDLSTGRRSAHRPKQARRSDRAGAPGIGGLSLVRSPDNLEISRRAAMAAPHSVHRERVNSSSS